MNYIDYIPFAFERNAEKLSPWCESNTRDKRVTLEWSDTVANEFHSGLIGIMHSKGLCKFFVTIFLFVCHFAVFYYDRTVFRKVGESEGGPDRERSTSWDSNSGWPKYNGALCRCAAHEAIGAESPCKNYMNRNVQYKQVPFVMSKVEWILGGLGIAILNIIDSNNSFVGCKVFLQLTPKRTHCNSRI